jgi:hypothetical protein
VKKRKKTTDRDSLDELPESGTYIILPRRRRSRGREAKFSPYYPRTLLTNAQLQALGRVVVETSNLESYLRIVLEVVSGVKAELADLFIRHEPISKLLSTFDQVAQKTLDDTTARAGRDLIGRLKKAIEDRNAVVHGHWVGVYDDDYIPRTALAYSRRPVPFSARGILAVAKELETLQYEIWEFAISAWPKAVRYVPELSDSQIRRRTRRKS